MKGNNTTLKGFALGILLVFTLTFISGEVWARAGGGRSGGSRGSRSFSAPSSPSPGTSQFQRSTPTPAPSPGFMNRPSTGSPFLRGLAGGLVGGFLGNMLFGGMGHGWGGGGMGGSGLGFLEIILIVVLIFLVFRFIRNRRQAGQSQNLYGGGGYSPPPYQQPETYAAPVQNPDQDVATGISHIQSMDQTFDPVAFKDWVQDLFFKIQAAWGNQDLNPVNSFLTEQMRGIFQQDLEGQKGANQINRLENIAVRSVDITEAWQEEGKDFVTILFYANLLDYTVDKSTGNVISGSKSEPVKFREFWTFVRPVGGRSPWQLSAIQQEN